MKKALLLLLVLIVVACGSDSPTSPSKPAYETANGEWKIIIDGNSTVYSITASEDFCYFLGDKYNGLWVGNIFSGSCVFCKNGANYSYSLKLNVLNNDSIEGHLHFEINVDNYVDYVDYDFTATRT